MAPRKKSKKFEDIVKTELIEVENTLVYRLPDQLSGFKNSTNISDFYFYNYPNLFFLECKSTHEKRFYFRQLTTHQYEGMLKAVEVDGVKAGVIIWFVGDRKLVYISIQNMKKMKDAGLISITPDKLELGKIVPSEVLKIFPRFDGKDLITLAREV